MLSWRQWITGLGCVAFAALGAQIGRAFRTGRFV